MTDRPDDILLDQAFEWYVRLQDCDVTEQERAGCAAWLAESDQHRAAWQRAEQVWLRLQPAADALRQPLPVAPAPPVALHRRGKPRWARAIGGLAAALVLALVGYACYDPAYLAEHRTAVAEQREWLLEDGSRVHLAPDSALDVDYQAGQRRIRLHRGEAWFQVAADAQRPFVVEAAGGGVRALGTAFSVRHANGGVRVLVSEHRVEVSHGKQQVRLEKGQAVHYDRDGMSRPVSVNLGNELAWRRQRLVFEDVSLDRVLTELQRYLSTRLVLTDAAVAALPVTTVLDTRQPEQALDSLAGMFELRLSAVGPWVTLVRAGE